VIFLKVFLSVELGHGLDRNRIDKKTGQLLCKAKRFSKYMNSSRVNDIYLNSI